MPEQGCADPAAVIAAELLPEHPEYSRQWAESILQNLRAAGWRVVPETPTDAMRDSYWPYSCDEAWTAMLEAVDAR